MSRKLSLLTVLLVLQAVLVLVFVYHARTPTDTEEALLVFDVAQVTGLTIADADTEVVIKRVGEDWQVGDYPADAQKVKTMIDKLVQLDAQWPVATSAASATRFEVAEKQFQRRILLDGAGDLPALYLGTSPGFQKVHARRADSDAIYSVELSNFEWPPNVDGWLDKKLLASDQPPTSITLTSADPAEQDKVLVKGDEGWLFNGEAANQEVAATYANRFSTLQVVGLAAPQPEELVALASIDLQNETEQMQVTISRLGESDDYVIAAQGDPAYFTLAAYIAEQLLMTDVDFSVADTDNQAESLQEED